MSTNEELQNAQQLLDLLDLLETAAADGTLELLRVASAHRGYVSGVGGRFLELLCPLLEDLQQCEPYYG